MKKFATLLTISTTAYGLAFDGPLPTPVADLVYAAVDGYSPRPTNEARSLPDLFRRQKKGSAVCGYLEGDAAFPLSCTSSGTCYSSPSHSWFGCCAGPTCSSSDIITRCINSASASNCLDDPACYNDAGAMACTAAEAPFCVNMFSRGGEGTMSHWVCGKSATSVGVVASGTGKSAGPTSVSVRSASKTADASAIRQGGTQAASGAAGGLNVATASLQVVPSSARATGGVARYTAGGRVGVVGGLVGVFAVLL